MPITKEHQKQKTLNEKKIAKARNQKQTDDYVDVEDKDNLNESKNGLISHYESEYESEDELSYYSDLDDDLKSSKDDDYESDDNIDEILRLCRKIFNTYCPNCNCLYGRDWQPYAYDEFCTSHYGIGVSQRTVTGIRCHNCNYLTKRKIDNNLFKEFGMTNELIDNPRNIRCPNYLLR